MMYVITYLLNKKLCTRLDMYIYIIYMCKFIIYISSIIVDITSHNQLSHHPKHTNEAPIVTPLVAAPNVPPTIALDVLPVATSNTILILAVVCLVSHGEAPAIAHGGAHAMAHHGAHGGACVVAPGVHPHVALGGVSACVAPSVAPVRGPSASAIGGPTPAPIVLPGQRGGSYIRAV